MGVVTGGGGGGGLPTGLTFTDAGGNPLLTLVSGPNGTAEITSSGLGAQVQIIAADGDASHVGGEMLVRSGASAGSGAGDLTVEAGSDAADGDGGAIIVESGSSVSWNGGSIDIRANGGAPAGNRGGAINVVAGQGTAHGGNVTVQGGGSDGNVQLYSGDGNQSVQLDNGGLNIGGTKLGFFQAAPVTQRTLTSGTATPEQIALGLQASTLMGGT